ncbi:hypothetical protein OG365_41385 (plasmid) [Streptomyces sp. NBC_00853]|uniref:hypothetical protein n=1 Tax=Streptomyces sp. NBC_00853 TaxID=2903681 RepID=UPI002F91562C|nr:hypothetical protein OG365_39460 [Streptomyces sp. NBC_00853]WTA24466.1 hypothetical protein OG365_41385 [Streptomyces sp. NBC_00853]
MYDPTGFQKPTSSRQDSVRRRLRRRTLRSLTWTAGHSIVQGSMYTLGTFLMGWVIWWIQQR